MMSLMCMALNPNLNAQQFQGLAEQHVKAQERALETVRSGFKELTEEYGPEVGMQYLVQVMPFVFW